MTGAQPAPFTPTVVPTASAPDVVSEAAVAPPPPGADPADVAEYALRLGDDALVLAHRLSEWAAHAPELEEDVALANIALDLLGQARVLLTRAGALERYAGGAGRTEDELAYLRADHEYRNVLLVERDNGDFAHTIARQLAFSAYQVLLLRALCGSTDPVLAGVAAKGVKEVVYHLDHARTWTLRLGDGTAESHRRMVAAVDEVWPSAAELFATDPLVARLADAGVAVDPATLWPQWRTVVEAVLAEATVPVPAPDPAPTRAGGRAGRHTLALRVLLAEMQSVHRAHPGARW